ncbi:hypothetical protein [Francisella tularensis]|uniref:hypothetical protein n=1 Tax=Francisella tularensis TaxID=263 RepID=UPI001680CE6E|nr:hypothetical protein [Francisella tularensis]MBD2809117.1 hypothetical protein [Francisella tularensis]
MKLRNVFLATFLGVSAIYLRNCCIFHGSDVDGVTDAYYSVANSMTFRCIV